MESIIKAKLKSTGETVNVISIWGGDKSYYERLDVCDTKPIRYSSDELDFSDVLGEAYKPTEPTSTPDYWTRLEHQYTGMFLKSLLDNYDGTLTPEKMIDSAINLARCLCIKLKNNNE